MIQFYKPARAPYISARAYAQTTTHRAPRNQLHVVERGRVLRFIEGRLPVGYCLRQQRLKGQLEAEQAGQGASQQTARLVDGGVWVFMFAGLRHNQKDARKISF